MTGTEQEDLENLIRHPGWLYLKAYAEKTWGEELSNHLRSAVNDTNDQAALQKMRQIIVAKDAVEALMRWPQDRISRMKDQSVVVESVSRGGYRA